MTLEADCSAQARTNPVFLTAKTAVCLMAQTGIRVLLDIRGQCSHGMALSGVSPSMERVLSQQGFPEDGEGRRDSLQNYMLDAGGA